MVKLRKHVALLQFKARTHMCGITLWMQFAVAHIQVHYAFYRKLLAVLHKTISSTA